MSARAGSLRIISGELGGRALSAPAGAGVRPSAGRTREAVFAMLGPVEGLSALDLFCGTGAYAFEALSRGAARATLVDASIETAVANAEALGVAGRVELVAGDALRYLEREGGRFDLVFCDPPYRLADRLGPELDRLLPDRLSAEGRVIVEGPRNGGPRLELPLLRERAYGAAAIAIYGAPER